MTAKHEALHQIVALIREHKITTRDIADAMDEGGIDNKKANIFGKVFAYIGTILVLSGIGVYIAMFWMGMNSAERVMVTLGPGIVLLVLAILAINDVRYSKIVTPLLLLSALLQPTGMMVAIHEFFPPSNDARWASIIVSGVMIFQQGSLFWKKRRPSLLFTTLIFGLIFFGTALDMMGMDDESIAIVIGLSLLFISYSTDKTHYRDVTPTWYLVGSGSFMIGLFEVVEGSFGELLFLGAACALIYSSVVVRSRMLLFTGAASMIGYIGYFAQEHFIDSVGLPLSLVIFGFILLGISSVAVKIGQKIKKDEYVG